MTGLMFADTRPGQRVVGNKLPKNQYELPEGWLDTVSVPAWGGETGKGGTSVLLLLQPDRSLDLKPSRCPTRTYIRDFKRTEELVEVLQRHTSEELQELMGLGKKLAKSHLERFQSFEKFPAKQACLIFGGEALQAADFSEGDQHFADAHLRLVSGLYGLLRPFDDVKPVRDLPMASKLSTKRGKTVCEFWGDSITKQLVRDAAELGKKDGGTVLLVVCLAGDYWAAVHASALPSSISVVQVAFEGATEENARRARGLFARYIVRKRVSDLEGLQDFSHDDWAFDRGFSRDSKLIFNWDGDSSGAVAPKVPKKVAACDPGYHSSGSSCGNDRAASEVRKHSSSSQSSRARRDSCSRQRSKRRTNTARRTRPSSSLSGGRTAKRRRTKRSCSSRSESIGGRRRRR
mmetsp:Transcript_998/g.3069  ORF Transcript_998/g.3069 Transcript_998/m.3069 type:complete len:404 (-) Transcript_998:172-1383(-)